MEWSLSSNFKECKLVGDTGMFAISISTSIASSDKKAVTTK
jgi:hypothetical protein